MLPALVDELKRVSVGVGDRGRVVARIVVELRARRVKLMHSAAIAAEWAAPRSATNRVKRDLIQIIAL